MSAQTKNKPKKKRSQLHEVWRRFRKNRTAMGGLIVMVLLVLMAIFAGVIAPGDGVNPGYDIQDLSRRLEFPSRQHIMGTDNLGRDIFARIVHGSRISLQVGFVVVSISMVAGVALGAIAGFYHKIDNIIMRFIDILLAIPNILLAISIAAALRPGLISVMIAVGIGAIPGYARIVRASVVSVREQEFIEAARSIGAKDFRLIRKHILPNCMAPIVVQATMGMAGAISAAAALSFIGLGLQVPIP
ncbi:MAG: ABC transporter permease, partial [Defluviitaleaceae bacterium]|nr:ABC transporter permease [Defluviitaleaceae bacterium]